MAKTRHLMPKLAEVLFLITTIVFVLSSGTVSASGMVDADYRVAYHVSGVVVDEQGRPVGSATVWRVSSEEQVEKGPPDRSSRYYRCYSEPLGETDEDGYFELNCQDTVSFGGLKGKEDSWILAVSHLSFKTQVTTATALWADMEHDNPNKEWGYILHDIRIVLEPRNLYPSDKESYLPVE